MALLILACGSIFAAPLNIPNTPLFISQTASPLTMIIMGRDHKLYYEAYNDASDIDGDGIIDHGYNPNIDYYGYFDSYKCYTYDASSYYFKPNTITYDKKCGGSWSGDFLNYLTTARIDALRKILYGGYRYYDTSGTTILERSFIPQDAHSWGKEYTGPTVDGYNIADYTPFYPSASGKRILFANTTLKNSTGKPLLRVAKYVPYRIWEWVSIERPVAGNRVLNGSSGPDISANIVDYVVRVKVCVSSSTSNTLEDNCQRYPNGAYKPVGVLQELGENDAMKFGLLTGSYGKNLSGGVLRKNIGTITDEIDQKTGEFIKNSGPGIIKTINNIRVKGFGDDYYYFENCGWITTRNIYNNECRMWGNPIAEMMYETLRYFAGKTTPTAAYAYANGGDDDYLNLPEASWKNPYASSNNPYCAKANMLVISDINPSHDSDDLPGSSFGNSVNGDLANLNVTTLGSTIWQHEVGANQLIFIGQSGSNSDGANTAKTANSFGNIRGLPPAEANAEGSYHAASIAYYGRTTDISGAPKTQNVTTYAVALNSPLPGMNIPVGDQAITFIPFAKSVGSFNINPTQGQFQPTNTIVDYYIESLTNNTGCVRINFEDVEQGADHDMDAITRYCYTVNSDNSVTVTVENSYAAGAIKQHMGYIISGTTADGIYLEVRDIDTTQDVDYFLDTPPGQYPGGQWNDNAALPTSTSRTFVPGFTSSAITLESPLWYAAKWGGFIDRNNDKLPNSASEYDADADNTPDNYFLATNAGKLKQQLTQALSEILNRSGSASSVAINNNILSTDSKLYQVSYNSGDWSGAVLAYAINADGNINQTGPGPDGSLWDSGKLLNNENPMTDRDIITYKPSTAIGIPFLWPVDPNSPGINELDSIQITALKTNPQNGNIDTNNTGEERLKYIRGVTNREQQNGGNLRNRKVILGDVINSAPHFVGPPRQPYRWDSGTAESNVSYTSFRNNYINRTNMLFVGSNDGMLHAFNADTGAELFAYVPNDAFTQLNQLTNPGYNHRYLADSPVNTMDILLNNAWRTVLIAGLNGGGQSIYALDVTDPNQFSETNADKISLWEFSDADDSDLGFTYSQPAIARMNNGEWVAIFGNGYNNTIKDGNISSTGNAVLYIVEIDSGDFIKFDTEAGTIDNPAGAPNGLATPVVVDYNGDHIADIIYAGDLLGNLWKIDVSSASEADWDFALTADNKPQPWFTAKDAKGNHQAITIRPAVSKDKYSGMLAIAFGTGKFLETGDQTNINIQSFYTLFDEDPNNSTTHISARTQLLEQSIIDQVSITATDNEQVNARITTDNQLSGSHRGWYIDLIYNGVAAGERVTTDPVSRNDKIIFTTLIPTTDPCGYGGDSWLMEMDAISGGRLPYTPFDVNKDNDFNTADFITTIINNQTTQATVSGLQSTVGITTTPAILTSKDKELLYLAGTSGNIQVVSGNPKHYTLGRLSWRQLQ